MAQPSYPAQPVYAQAPGTLVVDPRFITQAPLDLVMRESHGSGTHGDNMSIHDSQGRLWFSISAAYLTMSDRRQLIDASGIPVLTMKKVFFSLSGAWALRRGDSDDSPIIATIKPKLLSMHPTYNVFLNDGDKDEDYIATGNFRAKKFEIFHKEGGQKRVVATVKKQSQFASKTAFFTNLVSDADVYHVHIEAGVDAGFIAALVHLIDEMAHDQPK